jgi:hypothetical protein
MTASAAEVVVLQPRSRRHHGSDELRWAGSVAIAKTLNCSYPWEVAGQAVRRDGASVVQVVAECDYCCDTCTATR